eukprot:GHVQ01023519.1.p2 GENE.GHVQ01023519.1~~GHVQ01023519.1.p2  ORF type:complete len:103 (-),score=13.98 GHVQ01023519.1:7-315(-)
MVARICICTCRLYNNKEAYHTIPVQKTTPARRIQTPCCNPLDPATHHTQQLASWLQGERRLIVVEEVGCVTSDEALSSDIYPNIFFKGIITSYVTESPLFSI